MARERRCTTTGRQDDDVRGDDDDDDEYALVPGELTMMMGRDGPDRRTTVYAGARATGDRCDD